jgi:hypothetical protein
VPATPTDSQMIEPSSKRLQLKSVKNSNEKNQVIPEIEKTPSDKKLEEVEQRKDNTAVKQAKKEIESEFQDFHNASMFMESDSMLVSQTEFIDMNVEPEFKLMAPVLDSILEEKCLEKERNRSNMKITQTLSSFTNVTENVTENVSKIGDSKTVSEAKIKKRDTVNTVGTDKLDQYDSYRERKKQEANQKNRKLKFENAEN